MTLTPEQMEQAFRTWWAESYRVPANGQAVSNAVAWGMHLQGLLGGDVTDNGNFLFAVATDGTAWEVAGRPGWQQLPPLPEP